VKSVETLEKTTFSGRRFTRRQLARVQETVQALPNLSCRELALTLCEHLDWTTPNGTYKVPQCLDMLEKLEAQGIVRLPAKRPKRKPERSTLLYMEPEAAIEVSLRTLGPISLQLATTVEDRALWRSYVESHHYLGYKRPIGAHLFYFVVSEARQQKLGCLLFSAAAAWTLAPRDEWIGWDKPHREKCLPLVLSQNRFLIFPWVQVPNLATRVLSLSVKQVADDWVRVYQYRPVLIETFVDPARFSGTCYRAANWHYLGETQGRGHDPEHKHETRRKAIFAFPLQANWRQCLTQGHASRTLQKRYRNDVRHSRSRDVSDAFVHLWEKVVHIVHAVAREYDEQWRVRKRVLDSMLLMLLIFRLVSSRNSQSYGTTIDELWDSCGKLKIPLPQPHSVAPSSFCAARKKLDESIFKSVNQRIIEAYGPEAGRYAWCGHRLFAVDGSRLNLPRTLVARGYKPPSDNVYYPQGLLSCLYQVRSQLPFDFNLTPHFDERLCAAGHLKRLRPDDVVVYDRGYFSCLMLHRHREAGIQAVFRLQQNRDNVIRTFFASAQTDIVVDIVPSNTTRRNIEKQYPELDIVPLKLRLVKYEIAGTTYCLGTTLLDSARYPLNALMDVYHARWGVEELYKISKRLFVVEDFHARTERGVKQELYAHFVLITMNRLFANQADIDLNASDPPHSLRQHPQTGQSPVSNNSGPRIQTNFKNCIHAVVRGLEELLLVRDRVVTAVHHAFRFVLGRRQRRRPGRSYPRISLKPNTNWRPDKLKKHKNQKPRAAQLVHAAAPTVTP
jgi:hypothetical protein